MNPYNSKGKFVIAVPARTNYYNAYARTLNGIGLLRLYALGTRRGIPEVPPERTRLNPWIGLFSYAAARTLSSYRAESFRFRLHPWFDRWVLKQLEPGNHIISSYGYANECFQWVRQHGGKTFLDGGNSHPDNFWDIIAEEHRRWNCPYPPVPRHHYERSVAMMEHVDYVLSPSSYVTKSFLARGFKPEQILRNVYPVNLSCFSPARESRPLSRPLTLICTGSLSLRKGTPYLLEAFRLVRSKIPGAPVVADPDRRGQLCGRFCRSIGICRLNGRRHYRIRNWRNGCGAPIFLFCLHWRKEWCGPRWKRWLAACRWC